MLFFPGHLLFLILNFILKLDIYEESVLTQVFINDKLTCDSPIEALYFLTIIDLLRFYCGAEHSLTTKEDHYPLCEGCRKTSTLAKRKSTIAFAPQHE